jgi:hypothetical protein
MIDVIIRETYPDQGAPATAVALQGVGVQMTNSQIALYARRHGWKRRIAATCSVCKRPFITNHPRTHLCSEACRVEHRRRQHAEYTERWRNGRTTPRRRVIDESDEDPRVVAALKARDMGDGSLLEQILSA